MQLRRATDIGAVDESTCRKATVNRNQLPELKDQPGYQSGVLASTPDAEIYRSQPDLGDILGAWVLAEFGDDPDRYIDAKARKNYSGMSPITKPPAPNGWFWPLRPQPPPRRCADLQAFAALNNSPGARAFYDEQRSRGATYYQALRTLANRLVGILHGCLRHQTLYDEHLA